MYKLTFKISVVLAAVFVFVACQKEYSVEKGGFSGAAQGELVDSLGNCKTSTVVGAYSVDTPLVTTKELCTGECELYLTR